MTDFALPLGSRRILFVGGKGGVGKTTTAGALAVVAADGGERVLLVSTDPAHSLSDLFETRLGDRVRELAPGLHAMEVDPDAQVEAYLARVRQTLKGFVKPAMYAEIDRQIELTRYAPGAMEAALLDRVSEIMEDREGAWDRIIFDTAPTGHTLRLLILPEIMQAWTDGLLRSRDRSDRFGRALERLKGFGGSGSEDRAGAGEGAPSGDELSWFETPDEGPSDPRARKIREVLMERRRRFARARRILLDKERTAFILVLVPERLPILESRKALDVLESHGVPVVGLVVNRVLPDEAEGAFLERRRQQEAQYLERIHREFRDLPRVRIPLLPEDVGGIAALRRVGRHLTGA